MTLRDAQKHEVQQATDIVRLVGEQVALRPRGKEFLGLCPFHDDKNPSMHVSPVKQIYKCFSCGAGGDVFSFVMGYHKMSFPEALEYLAQRAGIKLERGSGRGARGAGSADEGPTDRERIADANAKAVGFFQALYRHPEHGRAARDYVGQRRIAPDMVAAFQLGYAPDRWDGLVTMIREKGWDQRAFELAGLIAPRNKDASSHQTSDIRHQTFFDRLRHRLIFPIFDAIGRPIAFGGRKLRSEDEPKYLNSPETPLFNKSATLYGLHLAKKPIIDSKTAVIVEGYTDVIACHQAHARNVVATLGTALTPQHVASLRHYAEKVVLVFDGDEAGQKAADRAVEVFLTGDLDVLIAVLPEGLDPADLLAREDGLEGWNASIEAARDALEFQFARVREQLEAAETTTGRQKLAEEYLRRLAQAGLERAGVIRKAMILQRLAGLLHLSEGAIKDLLRRLAPPPRHAAAAVSPTGLVAGAADNHPGNGAPDVAGAIHPPKIRALEQAQRQVIGCLLRDPGLFHHVLSDGRALDEAVTPVEFVSDPARSLYERVYQQLSDGEAVSLASLLADLASEGEQALADLATLAESEVESHTQGDGEKIAPLLDDACQALLGHHREVEYEAARRALTEATPADAAAPAEETLQEMRRLMEQRRANPSPVRIARLGS